MRTLVTLVGALALAGAGVTLTAQAPPPTGRTAAVFVADVDAIIHPVSAEFMVQTMDRADEAGAALVVFTLSTPGGLVDATRRIVSHMLAAKTPVAVFIAPPGARAASAGFILTIAADVAAMAPGTHIGAAHPVTAGGEPVDDTMKAKIESDVAAYARTLAEGRRRNIDLAQEAVVESRSFTEQEAMAAAPPLIDVVAQDVADLLRQIDGREIRRFDGSQATLETAEAPVVDVSMTLRQRVLSAIAHPNIAFILLSLGVLGLTIELWNPGSVFPGVVGAMSLLLAFFSLQMLPIDYTGVLFLALGVVLLLLEIKITSYGLLTAGGVISLVLGAMMLIDAPEPELRLSFRFVTPVIIAGVAIAVGLVRLGIAAQRQRPATGADGMVGLTGETVTSVTPDEAGQVRIRGEIWRAVAAAPIPAGTRVIVDRMEGLTLVVRHQADTEAAI